MTVESDRSLSATARTTPTKSTTPATNAREVPGSTPVETKAPSESSDKVSFSSMVAEVAAKASSLVNFAAWGSGQPANEASPAAADQAISASPASVSDFGKTNLKSGSRGPEVKALQEALNKKTGGNLKVDGIFGPNTQKALDQAKIDSGKTDSGDTDLGKTELKLGSRGPEVKQLQEAINTKTGGNLKVDGIFGPDTQKALDEAKKLENVNPGAAAGSPTNPASGGGNTPPATTPQGQSGGASGGGNTPPATTPENNSAETQPTGQQQAPGSGTLQKGANGRVNQNDLRAYLEQRIGSSGLSGFKPQDGATYGVDGSAKSWANFMTKLVGKESNFNSNDVSEPDAFEGGSRGLFQLSFADAKNHGLNGGKSFSAEQLADPKANADAAVSIMEKLVKKTGTIRGGAGKYWGPIKRGWTGQQ